MNKETCYKIIKDTLQDSFDRDRFVIFTKNLLNSIDETKAFHAHGYVKEKFKQTAEIVKTYERIGTYTDPEGKKIDVLVVYLQKENSIDRARTALRNFVADYLKQRDQKDAALVAFVSPSSNDWRFSLIKMDYKFEEGKNGKTKVTEEFTPARRWSFLVGAKENCHTAQSRLAPLILDDSANPTLSQIEEAFNIEKVTKEFFEKYRELFLGLKDNLDQMIAKDEKIKQDFIEKDIDSVDFAKKLLGQIVFLYFLQKKGWFGVERDSDWGSGPKDFLRQLYEKKHGNYQNFFNETLEPLFYSALARERDDNYYDKFNCKIPFLNGGLFDPIGNYDWVHTDILLENELFSNTFKDLKTGDVGNGILDIFDRYNFTVREDEPLEKEVAVDPEMLGKVFENLLEVKDRKSKGTYYTPREIVHYMCEQSLVNYLSTELQGLVEKPEIEEFIKIGDLVLENEYLVADKGENDDRKFEIGPAVIANAKEVDRKLADIKVCDPAIGSGAFPVGMMNEIVTARLALNPYINEENRTAYDFKNHCITDSLYGVDIDPGAVEIAKLRLWLSLVVDEDDIHYIKPLPNLDYKIMQGNSLLEEFEGIKLFDEKIIPSDSANKESQIKAANEKISELQKEYFKLHSSGELSAIKKQLIEKEIAEKQKFIKILNQKSKFDGKIDLFRQADEVKEKWDELTNLHKKIVSQTNRQEKKKMLDRASELEWQFIESTLRRENKTESLKKVEQFKKKNTKPFFLWHLHFSEVFQSKSGFDITITNPPYETSRSKGILENEKIYLKNNYSTAEDKFDYYTFFIEKSSEICKPAGDACLITPSTYLTKPLSRKIRQFLLEKKINDIKEFKGLVFQAIVPTAIILFQNTECPENHLMQAGYDINNIADFVEQKFQQKLIREELFLKGPNYYINIYSDESFYLFVDKLLNSEGVVKLGVLAEIYNGIQTGDDKQYVSLQKKSNEWQPVITGSDIHKYYLRWGGKYVHYKPELLHSNTRRNIFKAEEKLIIRQTADKIIGTYDNNSFFTLASTFVIKQFEQIMSYKTLLGILNSKLFVYLYRTINNEAGRILPQIKKKHIFDLPIQAKTSNVDIEKAVTKILTITESKDYLTDQTKKAKVCEYEKQIDQMVYKLYELTPNEIEMIEKS